MFFNMRCLCCCKIRWEEGKQYANPVGCEQITDVKTDMVVVGLAKKGKTQDDWVIEYEQKRKVSTQNKHDQVIPITSHITTWSHNH